MIALFYTDAIVWGALAIAGIILVMAVALNAIGVRNPQSRQCS